MKRKERFPKYVFANWFKDNDGSKSVNAFENQVDAVDDDGTTDVATYVLVKVNRISKSIRIEA